MVAKSNVIVDRDTNRVTAFEVRLRGCVDDREARRQIYDEYVAQAGRAASRSA